MAGRVADARPSAAPSSSQLKQAYQTRLVAMELLRELAEEWLAEGMVS
jgi:hypothetical protein